MKDALYRTAEQEDEFYSLIDTKVTFRNDIITIGGHIIHSKGDKATIMKVYIVPGHWHRQLPDLWTKEQLSSIVLNEENGVCYIASTFEETKHLEK